MSEFWDATTLKCPYCNTKFASCEGPNCDCEGDRERERDDYLREEDDGENEDLS